MPPELEEVGVEQAEAGLVLDEVAHLDGEGPVGQQAPAAGAGIFADLPFLREADLLPARPAVDGVELLPVDPALGLGDGRREELRGEGAQDDPPAAAVPVDGPHRVFPLGHRPLPHHLARDEEGGADLLHERARQPEREDPAVDAGVHAFPEAVGGPTHDVEVFLSQRRLPEGDAQAPGGEPR
jgi:hypothetical protein